MVIVTDGLRRLETRKKIHNSNKRYDTRLKGSKFEENVQNLNGNMQNYETKVFFSFAKQIETLFSWFRIFSVSRNERNSVKQ